jgi:hypothetical protein
MNPSARKIQPGQIIHGPRWREPVEIKLVKDLGEYVHLIGATIGTREHMDQLIPRQELALFEIARVDADFSASPRDVFLSLETRRYRFVSLYHPLLAINISKVDVLPPQIEGSTGTCCVSLAFTSSSLTPRAQGLPGREWFGRQVRMVTQALACVTGELEMCK